MEESIAQKICKKIYKDNRYYRPDALHLIKVHKGILVATYDTDEYVNGKYDIRTRYKFEDDSEIVISPTFAIVFK